MKKCLLVLASILAVSLLGCGGSNPSGPANEWTVQGTIYCADAPDGVEGAVALGHLIGEDEFDLEYFVFTTEFTDGEATYTITGVEEDTYDFATVVDMNGNMDPDDPEPDEGDLVCTDMPEYTIDEDMTIDYAGGWEYFSGWGGGEGWFPMQVGTCWCFDLDGTAEYMGYYFDITGSRVLDVTGTAEHTLGFDVYVTLDTVIMTVMGMSDTTATTWYFHVCADMVEVYSDLYQTAAERLLELPLAVGDSWYDAFYTYYEVISLSETVSVPAGVFSGCALVYSEASGDPVWNNTWYADGEGIVQLEACYEDQGMVMDVWMYRTSTDSPRVGSCRHVERARFGSLSEAIDLLRLRDLI